LWLSADQLTAQQLVASVRRDFPPVDSGNLNEGAPIADDPAPHELLLYQQWLRPEVILQ
jgi:hypothetical protein